MVNRWIEVEAKVGRAERPPWPSMASGWGGGHMRVLAVTNLFPNTFQPARGIFNWRLLSLMQKWASVRVIAPVLWTDDLRSLRKRGLSLVTDAWRPWDGVSVVYPRYYYTPWLFRRYYG